MPEHARSTAEIVRASEHLLYEIEMLCALSAYFESGAIDDAVRVLEDHGIVVRNAVVEAFQLHARQLIDFLTGSDDRDMRASDFTAEAWRLERTPAYRTDFDRFSQRVMHLSLQRATFTSAQQRVETRRIRRELGADIEQFLDAINEQSVCDRFVDRARAALLASQPPRDPVDTELPASERDVGYSGGTATAGLPTNHLQ